MSANADAVIETLQMFLQSDSAAERLDKERDKFKNLFKSINAIGETGRFNSLIKTISVSQDLIQSAIKQAIQNVDAKEVDSPSDNGSDEWTPDFLKTEDEATQQQKPATKSKESPSSKIADALLANWVHSLTSGYDGTKIKQILNTDMAPLNF